MLQWEFLAQKQEMLIFKEKNKRNKNTILKPALLDYHLLLRETHEKTLKTYSSPRCQKTTSHCFFSPTVATTHTRDFHPKLNVSFNLLRVRLWMCTRTFKISSTPERSSSKLLWHFLPQSGSFPYVHTGPDSESDTGEQTMNKTLKSQLVMLWPTTQAWIHTTHQRHTS